MKNQNPMAKYQLRAFGSKTRDTEGAFANKGGNAARDERRAGKRENAPMTFSEMQAEGIARPAPAMMQAFTGRQAGFSADNDPGAPPVPPVPGTPYAPAPAPTPGSPDGAPAGGGAGGGSVYDRLRAAGLANIKATFAGRRDALNEDNARRGLWASTYGSGRMGDLEGQQSRAEADLEANLLSGERDNERQTLELLARLSQMFGGA